MNDNFDYKKSITSIKASLFDIYENQEQEIGFETDETKRNKKLSSFIEVKNVALMLLEGIENLYTDTIEKNNVAGNKLTNPEISLEEENSKILDLVEKNDSPSIEDNEDIQINNNNEEIFQPKKYYLNCDSKNINFAYVPKEIYETIKNNKKPDEDKEQEEPQINIFEEQNQEEMKKDFKIYKQDDTKRKGIIVRNDQYMKLALSKKRQENILKEAKDFRISEVNRKRKENQKIELEKARINLNI